MENNQTNTYMEETNSELVHTYNRFPVVLDHGEGVYLYDTEGKKYLDFAAGIAVCGPVSYTHLQLPDMMQTGEEFSVQWDIPVYSLIRKRWICSLKAVSYTHLHGSPDCCKCKDTASRRMQCM